METEATCCSISSSSELWAFGWLCYYPSNQLWLCRLAVLSSEKHSRSRGCNSMQRLLRAAARGKEGDHETSPERLVTTTRRTAREGCTALARVIYSTELMSEEEHGGGWHDNLQQAADLVAMATNEENVCIRGKSQRRAHIGGDGEWSGSRDEKRWRERGGTPSLLLITRRSLAISFPQRGGGSCPTRGTRSHTPITLL